MIILMAISFGWLSTYALQDSQIEAKSAILIDGKSGRVIYEKNADEKLAPASLTKMMVLIIAMEELEKGNLTLDEMLTVSQNACNMGGSQIWLEVGEQMSINDIIKSICVVSANDAAVALGEHIAGDELSFVARMNEKAEEMGLKNTHFENPTGLDDDNHYSSARDMALMGKELLRHPLILEFSTIWIDSIRNGENQLVNTNKLLKTYPGIIGLKTGTTSKAGYCVCEAALRNNLSLISVTMGSDTSEARFKAASTLLDYGFANYQMKPIENTFKEPIIAKVKNSPKTYIKCKLENPQNEIFVEKDATKELKAKLNMDEVIEAPIVNEQVLGKIEIYMGDEKIGEYNVVADGEAPRFNFINAAELVFQKFFSFCY